jgi:hypothetical protein
MRAKAIRASRPVPDTIAPVDIDPDTLTVRMDWHGYGLDQVETWADRIVEAAWSNGFEHVEFVHGSPAFGTRGSFGRTGGAGPGRGTIKELLRRRLFGNRWHRWAHDRSAGLHEVDEGRMLISLRENPQPRRQAKWPLVPPPLHERP